MSIDFVQSDKLGHGWRLEVRRDGLVVGVIVKNQEKYFFYTGADIKLGSLPALQDTDLENLKAAVQQLF